MEDTATGPDPGLVYDLYTGIFAPQVIRLALQLDVFTPLAAGSASAEQVAQSCGCDPLGMKRLLDCLCSVQVLACQGDRYALTPTAATFLVKGRKAYAGDMILRYTGQELFDGVQRSVRSGQPSSLDEDFVQDAWLESYSQWRIANSLEMWQAAGVKAGNGNRLRILDIACGCAIKSLSLAQAAPNVQVTCLDKAAVLVVARDLAQRLGVESQAAFRPADLREADLGQELFDAVLAGQITHYLPAAQNASLFRRVHAALAPNGVFVIDCPMATDEPDEATSLLSLLLWADSGGAAHSFEAYRDWLRESGFRQVRQLSERWLAASN